MKSYKGYQQEKASLKALVATLGKMWVHCCTGWNPGVEEKVEIQNAFVVLVFTERADADTFHWCPVKGQIVKDTN